VQSGSDLEEQTPAKQESSQLGAPQQRSANGIQCDNAEGKQTNRIFWIIPNYRAVSVGIRLPPQTVREKFWLATQDSFDYSSFVLAGLVAGYSQATNANPEFDDGAAAAARYYWHSFADETVGNYFTEAIVPALTREDPRYYTLGAGVSDLYYPRQDRTLGQTGTKIAMQIGIDGIANILKEFWPDISRGVYRQ
jgi:hypothetical protein